MSVTSEIAIAARTVKKIKRIKETQSQITTKMLTAKTTAIPMRMTTKIRLSNISRIRDFSDKLNVKQ